MGVFGCGNVSGAEKYKGLRAGFCQDEDAFNVGRGKGFWW